MGDVGAPAAVMTSVASTHHEASWRDWLRFSGRLSRKMRMLQSLVHVLAVGKNFSRLQRLSDSPELASILLGEARALGRAASAEIKHLGRLRNCIWQHSERGGSPLVFLAAIEIARMDPVHAYDIVAGKFADNKARLGLADVACLGQAVRIAALLQVFESCTRVALVRDAGSYDDLATSTNKWRKLKSFAPDQNILASVDAEKLLDSRSCVSFRQLTAETQNHNRIRLARFAKRHGKTEVEVVRDLRDSAEAASLDFVGALDQRLEHERSISPNLLLAASFLIGAILSGVARLLGVLPIWGSVPLAFALTDVVWGLLLRVLTVLRPRGPLPSMDLSSGITSTSRTVICFPIVLTNVNTAGRLLDWISHEWRHHTDENVGVAILTDWPESINAPATSDETANLEAALASVRHQNLHDGPFGGRVFLGHRRRQFSATQGSWIGWERKRGKIAQLCEFVETGKNGFDVWEGSSEWLRECTYCIVLDEDTRSTPRAVRRLIEIASHPANSPVISKNGSHVVRGHAAFSPIIAVPAEQSWLRTCLHWFTGAKYLGDDNTLQKNNYFEVFGQSQMPGQGLLDIRYVHTVCTQAIPAGCVLSHDTFESALLRSAHVSDVAFVGPAPKTYHSLANRLHRWTRGDLQNLAILLGFRDEKGKKTTASSLGEASDIFTIDNVRRSLNPLISTLLLIAAARSSLAVVASIGIVTIPIFIALAESWLAFLKALLRIWPPPSITSVARLSIENLLAITLRIAMLPHLMLMSLDAVVRTLFRLVTRRRLLEWIPSRLDQVRVRANVRSIFYMILASLFSTIALISQVRAQTLASMFLVLLGVWSVSPILLHRLKLDMTRSH